MPPDPFQERARNAGPLAPGHFRAVPTDSPTAFLDFPDLKSAQKYADDVASEGDYEFIPPTAYIYDRQFRRVGEGTHYAQRADSGLIARLRRLFGGR